MPPTGYGGARRPAPQRSGSRRGAPPAWPGPYGDPQGAPAPAGGPQRGGRGGYGGANGLIYGGAAPAAAADRTGMAAAEFLVNMVLLIFVLIGLILTVAAALWAHDVSHAYRDVTIEADVRALATPRLTSVMLVVNWLGTTRVIAVTVALIVIMLALLRQVIQAVTLVMSVLGGTLLALSFKPLVARLGPGQTHPPTGGFFAFNHYAFPSGHAMYFLTCFVPVAWFLWEWRPRGDVIWQIVANVGRVLLCAGFLALAALGGFSQIYLGFHWPTDVLGGYAIGGFWSGLVLLMYMRFRDRVPLGRRAGR